MSRVTRVVVPGFPHHVTQRGNRRADVFVTDADREAYLHFLRTYSQKRGLSVWAYCLMSNHVHLVVVPAREKSLSEGLRDAHTVYAMNFNERTQLSGHVWQGRFHSCVLDNAHLWAAVRYVELNPVRAGMAERAQDYPWSSAAAHCGLRRDPLLSPGLPLVDAIPDWPDWLNEPIENEPEMHHTIRTHTHTGRPCGSPDFVARLESLIGHPLRPRTHGPKPGAKYTKRKVS
jgi:putative transposase